MDQARDFAADAVAAVKRNARETILFYTEVFRDQQLGHVRICVPNKAGVLIPTGKGLTLTKEHLSAFAEGLEKLADKLNSLPA